ncbi:MAG: AraC family transcriptional regulator [Cyanobacteria bacterium P01_D01_bin.6]
MTFEMQSTNLSRLISLDFYFSGCAGALFEDYSEDLTVFAGKSVLISAEDLVGKIEFSGKKPLSAVSLLIDFTTFKAIVQHRLKHTSFDSNIEHVLDQIEQGFYCQTAAMLPWMQTAAKQILDCPFQGVVRQLYLESKAIELISLYLHQCSINVHPNTLPPQLCSEEIERVYLAKEILLANLEHPPSLLELAQRVGLNDCKLKRGFRQLLGTTAFGYLYQQRMEKARDLLKVDTMNITEVAAVVGYTNPSAFGAAFKRRFGTTPSAYRRQ